MIKQITYILEPNQNETAKLIKNKLQETFDNVQIYPSAHDIRIVATEEVQLLEEFDII